MLRKFLFLAVVLPSCLFAQEVCNNGIDDDGDGLIDLNDPDCPCSLMLNVGNDTSFIHNPSFEQRTCCPLDFVTTTDFLSCATGWHQATGGTSDYINMCGYAPPVFPLPPPDGVACVGFGYGYGLDPAQMEYVGSCISDHPLLAGTSYTISLWVAGTSMSDHWYNGQIWGDGMFYEGTLPLVIYGHTNCVPFPIPQTICSADPGGWFELGRVYHQPNGQWNEVSITFTPAQQINSVMIGGGCEIPETFVGKQIGPNNSVYVGPYFLVDDLHLTKAEDQILLPVTQQGDVCAGDVQVQAAPPAGAQNFQWYLNGVALVGQTNPLLEPSSLGLGGGTYAMASTVGGECLMGATNVAYPHYPVPAFELQPHAGCSPLHVSFTDTTAGSIVTAHWTYGDNTSGDGTPTEHTYAGAGDYDVSLTVTNDKGCSSDTTVVAAVHVVGGPVGAISATPNPTDVEHTTVSLSGSGSNGIVTWWWDFGAVPPGIAVDPAVTVNFPAEPGSYPVMLVVENAAGCRDTVRSVIVITATGEVEMPNVFSPNNDGYNDVFIPLNYTGAPGTLKIYNRWGQQIYTTEALGRGWDGRAEGGPVPAGTYYYVVQPLGNAEPSAGHFTLVR